ncbi:hypothetical protein [Hymenobacter negativus]|uniref:Uncharacterized protein n=1 Tax=Hymenobacter negativus TaxID=2795026 RepID=A0ABS0Q6X1_9BACT|nr:hypothetical protein [Hymenobacter negativus]MBH8558237.1 hypothetical protein [Hymenobacter negativus]
MIEVRLSTRAAKKKWFAIATGWITALTLVSAFSLVWGRLLQNALLFAKSLSLLIILTGVQVILKLMAAARWISIYQMNDINSITLSEKQLFLGSRGILVAALESLTIESDGYTGKWAGRTNHTGKGKLSFVHRLDKSKESCLITIASLHELNNLRALAEIWRNEGLAVLIMD